MARKQGRILITKGLLDQAVQRITSGVIPLFDEISPIITGCTSTPAAINIATRGRLCKAPIIAAAGWLNVQCVIEETPVEVEELIGYGGLSYREDKRKRKVYRKKKVKVCVRINGVEYCTEKFVAEDVFITIKDLELRRTESGQISVFINEPVVTPK